MNRVAVIGSGGAGKSTFARELGEILNITPTHLDVHYWRPDWRETPREEWSRGAEGFFWRGNVGL